MNILLMVAWCIIMAFISNFYETEIGDKMYVFGFVAGGIAQLIMNFGV